MEDTLFQYLFVIFCMKHFLSTFALILTLSNITAQESQTTLAVLDFEGRGIDVVHRRLVRAPAEAVGDGDAVEHGADAVIGIKAVHAAAGGVFGYRHGAGPEPALWVAFAVVAAVRRVVRLDIGQFGQGAGVQVERGELI